jgi:hypothetical protein
MPELPECATFGPLSDLYTADQMRAYGLKCIAAVSPQAPVEPTPIDMILHCPLCGVQHIDTADFEDDPSMLSVRITRKVYDGWTNPPHRSHLCSACGNVWRPADVATNGVREIKTRGKGDTWNPTEARVLIGDYRKALGAKQFYFVRQKGRTEWEEVDQKLYERLRKDSSLFDARILHSAAVEIVGTTK